MSEKIRKIARYGIPLALFALILFMWAKGAFAQSALGEDWMKVVGQTGLKRFAGTGGVEGEADVTNVLRRAISLVRYGMGGVAIIFGILYASGLVFARGNEEAIGKQKKNFLWAFMGFVILMVADGVAQVFNPVSNKVTSDQLIDFNAARDQLRTIADYLKYMLGSIMVLMMTISGIKLIVAQGNEEAVTKQKTNVVYSGIGMLVILLASNIVNAVYVINTGEVQKTGVAANTLGNVIRLILVFLGPAVVLFTIYAGFMYLTALDNEERSKKAKAMIVGGITGIVIIYSAYALVNTFYKPEPFTIETVCADLKDDDKDGKIDCADEDCAQDPNCASSNIPPLPNLNRP